MENIDWELKNLDSLKEYIFNDLIGEHPNTSDINEAINTYAERYHEMKLKLLGIADVVGQSEQLHKMLQYLSDEDELVGGRTHQAIIDSFNQLG